MTWSWLTMLEEVNPEDFTCFYCGSEPAHTIGIELGSGNEIEMLDLPDGKKEIRVKVFTTDEVLEKLGDNKELFTKYIESDFMESFHEYCDKEFERKLFGDGEQAIGDETV